MSVPIDPKLLNLFTLFWSFYQDHEQGELSEPAPVPGTPVEVVGVSRVEQRVDQMLLVVQAMWTLLQEKTGLTDAELMARVTDLDARDGQKDGRITRPPVKCAKCGAAVARKFNRCLFCGEPYEGGNAFDTV
jgi:hypothetical protein